MSIIIIGGGSSIKKIIPFKLWDNLKNLFVLGINFSFRDILPTALITCDYKFYRGLINLPDNTYNKDFYEELKQLPMIIIPDREDLRPHKMDNTLIYDYIPNLCENSGLYTLNLAIQLQPIEIYLLGFDFDDTKGQTHYYNHTKHRGIGQVSRDFFKRTDANKLFSQIDTKNINIYNVSPDSKIDLFPKITPKDFIQKIKTLPKLNQEDLRNKIDILLS